MKSPLDYPLSPYTVISSTGSLKISREKQHMCYKVKEDRETDAELVEGDEHFGIDFQDTKRQVVLGTTLAAFSFPQLISIALAENDVPEGFRIYTDDVTKFKILILQGAGEPTGFKSVTAFYPEQEGNSSISVVITGLGPDFTKMESFGKVEAFAETAFVNLLISFALILIAYGTSKVSGLDRSWQRPAGVAAKLIDCKASKERMRSIQKYFFYLISNYFTEYSLQKPGKSCKHLFSALGMATNGWYNRLYTVTGLYLEEESDKYSSNVKEALKSFRFI
ncbi:psbP domain-containing protein 3 [Pyrus ussuriensis x Pyrus communis]|uniref:PsbP domain-containing protein 3 n=1 Tax=Pyrus ussuriensis x Pyrus communis TaxID=2448454 RepID=A0A5N5HYP6_9ROSA|nr:psbP domain-containing protein 3 [Pyrus ussuriensis x Pyrus communis]